MKPAFLLAEAGDAAFHPSFDMTYDWDVIPMLGDVAGGAKPVAAIDDVLPSTQLVPYAAMPDALVMRMTYNHDDNGKFTLASRYRGGIKTFAVLAATLPGKPLVFDGQEVGMNRYHRPDLGCARADEGLEPWRCSRKRTRWPTLRGARVSADAMSSIADIYLCQRKQMSSIADIGAPRSAKVGTK